MSIVLDFDQWQRDSVLQQCHQNVKKDWVMVTEQFMDVSMLEAPEPLNKTMLALDDLTQGSYLRLHLSREPVLLYPMLNLQGFDYESRDVDGTKWELLIWKKGDMDVEKLLRDH